MEALYGELTQSTIFTVIAIFSLLRQAFFLLPASLIIIPQYATSFERVQTFISQPDIEPLDIVDTKDAQIKLENASFQWPGAPEPVLRNINLDVRFEEFLARIFVLTLFGRPKKEI